MFSVDVDVRENVVNVFKLGLCVKRLRFSVRLSVARNASLRNQVDPGCNN